MNSFYLNSDQGKNSISILNMQEEDRKRIARELHDTSLQNLTHIIHKIELSSMYIDQDPIRAKLELAAVGQSLRSVIDEIRNTIFNLRPMTFDDLGLGTAFEELVLKINAESKYHVDMDVEDITTNDDVILTTIYRVVQEIMFNIDKHSDADHIFFHTKNVGSNYVLDIKDNGRGFSRQDIDEKKDKHFGLLLITERVRFLGGKIIIGSELNKGTEIHIEVPLNYNED